jgi:hypothetical protein
MRSSTSENCRRCARLEATYEVVIEAIHEAMRGPRPFGEKLAEIYRYWDERDRIIQELYAHKADTHRKRAA